MRELSEILDLKLNRNRNKIESLELNPSVSSNSHLDSSLNCKINYRGETETEIRPNLAPTEVCSPTFVLDWLHA